MKGWHRWVIAFACFVVAFGLRLSATELNVKADPLNNAYEFYNTYQNQTVFIPVSETDGEICFGTRAGNAGSSAGVSYGTVGWQVFVQDKSGRVLQRINYKRGGNYLKQRDERVVNNYTYILYTLSLRVILGQLNSTAREAVNSGNAYMKLNACMVVNKFGTLTGSMDNNGNITGTIYTDYTSMCNSYEWSQGAKEGFRAYYDKTIENIYRSLSLNGGLGVERVSGAGTYIYGSKVSIDAVMKKGYVFAYWSGSSTCYTQKAVVTLSDNYAYTAYGRASSCRIYYYRNLNGSDTVYTSATYYYGSGAKSYAKPSWTQSGYQLWGWSSQRNASKPEYVAGSNLADDYVWTHQSGVNLYAVWQPNSYTIRYEIEGASHLSSPVNTRVGEVLRVDDSMRNSRTGYPVLFWSTRQDGMGLRLEPGQTIDVTTLAKSVGVFNSTGVEIKLYGVWACAPEILAEDYYFSLEEARNGLITEEKLASYIRCQDDIDGVIRYGRNGINDLYIENFAPERYQSLTEDACLEERIIACNSIGYSTIVVVKIHVVDTSFHVVETNVRKRIRFVSKKYLFSEDGNLREAAEGGLPENSLWRIKTEYLQILRDIY